MSTPADQQTPDQAPTRRRILLHPVLVTVPVGCWVGSVVLDIASRAGGRPVEFTTASTWLLGIGLVIAVVAGVAGFVDALPIQPGTVAHKRFVIHMMLAGAAIILYMLDFLMRLGAPPDQPVPAGLLMFSLANTAVLAAAMSVGTAIRRAAG